MIRLGLISFSDGRQRVHESLVQDILIHQNRIEELLEQTGENVVFPAREVVYSVELARQEALSLNSLHLDAVLFNIPVFAFPNFLVITAKLLRGPYLLLCPQDPRYPGLGGCLEQVEHLTRKVCHTNESGQILTILLYPIKYCNLLVRLLRFLGCVDKFMG